MNLTLPEADIVVRCAADNIAISAMEPLASGGTRLVCITLEGADKARLRFSKHIIQGPVRRYPLRARGRQG